MLHVTRSIQIPDSELELTYVRSSGPGGQNVNKVNTRAVLRWNVETSPSLPDTVRQRFLARFAARLTKDGDLVLQSQKYRRQSRNAADCLERLREMLLQVVRPPAKRQASRPTRGSVERRLQNKRQRSEKKQQRRPPTHE